MGINLKCMRVCWMTVVSLPDLLILQIHLLKMQIAFSDLYGTNYVPRDIPIFSNVPVCPKWSLLDVPGLLITNDSLKNTGMKSRTQ